MVGIHGFPHSDGGHQCATEAEAIAKAETLQGAVAGWPEVEG